MCCTRAVMFWCSIKIKEIYAFDLTIQVVFHNSSAESCSNRDRAAQRWRSLRSVTGWATQLSVFSSQFCRYLYCSSSTRISFHLRISSKNPVFRLFVLCILCCIKRHHRAIVFQLMYRVRAARDEAMGVRHFHGFCGTRVRLPVLLPAGDERPQRREHQSRPERWLLSTQ